jgi:hypothetical protein
MPGVKMPASRRSSEKWEFITKCWVRTESDTWLGPSQHTSHRGGRCCNRPAPECARQSNDGLAAFFIGVSWPSPPYRPASCLTFPCSASVANRDVKHRSHVPLCSPCGRKCLGRKKLWRKRVGVEPTIRPAKDRITGFEGRERHRTLFASDARIPSQQRT